VSDSNKLATPAAAYRPRFMRERRIDVAGLRNAMTVRW
jgi:hypothetical protein